MSVKIRMAENDGVNNGVEYFLRSAVSVQEKVQGLKVTGPTAIAVDGYVCISCLIIKRPKKLFVCFTGTACFTFNSRLKKMYCISSICINIVSFLFN